MPGRPPPATNQALTALGGRWDADAKGWRVPADKADAARALVGGPAPKSPRLASLRLPGVQSVVLRRVRRQGRGPSQLRGVVIEGPPKNLGRPRPGGSPKPDFPETV